MEKKARKKKGEDRPNHTSEKPVSLYHLTPEEALKKLLQVPPEKDKRTKSPAVKRG